MIAHVIHDVKRADRWKLFRNEAITQGFFVRSWPAIMHEKPCTGISQAHKQIVRWAQKEGLPEVLIMEDDVRFTDAGAFDWWLSQKPAEFDIYMAGTYWGEVKPDWTIQEFSGLHCYIVSERFYSRFLEADEAEHLDRWLAGKGQYYCSLPFAAIQWNGFSDNVKRVVNYDDCLKGRDFYKKNLAV